MTLNTTYLNRISGRLQKMDPEKDTKFQWVFVFQQGVDKLPPAVRHAVHTRILLR